MSVKLPPSPCLNPRASEAGWKVAFCEHCNPKPRTELTPIGEQFVIPGCEHDTTHSTTPAQLNLWR